MANTRIEKRILNCLRSRNIQQDWTIHTAAAAGTVKAAAPIPTTKDLRENWWEIGDQGNTGSCVGWASTDSVLRWHFVKTGQIAQNDHLSVRFTWMAAKEIDEFTTNPTAFVESDGTSLKAALDVARKYGSVLDHVLPFGIGILYQDETDVFYAIAARGKITSYFNLGLDITNWRRWLATKGPILTRLDVDNTFMNAPRGKLTRYDRNSAIGGHAVAFVGYTKDHFIVRNSWGKSWGDKGFAYASNAYARAAFTEAYGVVV